MKILFIGNSRLGDAILSTPILNHYNLKKNKITVVCSPLSKEIYSSFLSVEKIIVLKKKKKGLHWLKAYTLLESAKWDIVIDLRNTILSRFVRKSHVKRLISSKGNIHKVVEYCNLINLKEKTPIIPANSNFRKSMTNLIIKKNIKKPILAVAPVTNWVRKDWPLKNYSLLTKKLLNNQYNFKSVILLGSKKEKYQCNKLEKSINNKNVFNLAGSLKILEIFELLKLCKLFIGNDSGLTHLSAASETNTLGLFGPSKDENYRPWGRNGYFIRTPESYRELVEVEGYNRFDKSSLMKNLLVDDVFKMILSIISKKTKRSL